MKRWLSIAVVVGLGFAGVACSRTSAKAVGRLTLNGRAQVTELGGAQKKVTASRTLRSGEQVKMLDGTATLGLGSGRQLELRKGTEVRLALRPGPSGRSEPQGELVAGDMLVLAAADPATVVAADSTVTVNSGIARVSRGIAVVVATYQGGAGIETGGRSASVPALRQVTVPAPGLPSRASPIAYSASDSWDQRYLGDAIDLGNQLVTRSRGFSSQLPAGQGTSVGFFRQVLPDLSGQAFDASLLGDPVRSPGENLVGAAITLLGTRQDFVTRWKSVFAFHEDGASWGLVALDQGVARAPLLSSVDAAIARATPGSQQAAGGGATTPTTRPSTAGGSTATTLPSGTAGTGSTGGTGGTGGTSGTAGTGGTGGTGASPGGSASSATTSPPASGSPTVSSTPLPNSGRGPVDLGLPVVDDTLNAVIDTLSGLLRALGPS